MVTVQGLQVVDAFQPREFLKMWAELLLTTVRHPIASAYLETVKEYVAEVEDVTWLDVIVLIDFFYTILTLTLLIDEHPKESVNIVRKALVNAMRDRLLCRLMAPVYLYASERIPEAVKGLNYQCENKQTF
jgi:hypothetical protein